MREHNQPGSFRPLQSLPRSQAASPVCSQLPPRSMTGSCPPALRWHWSSTSFSASRCTCTGPRQTRQRMSCSLSMAERSSLPIPRKFPLYTNPPVLRRGTSQPSLCNTESQPHHRRGRKRPAQEERSGQERWIDFRYLLIIIIYSRLVW